jgi:hypothetical protein
LRIGVNVSPGHEDFDILYFIFAEQEEESLIKQNNGGKVKEQYGSLRRCYRERCKFVFSVLFCPTK